MISATCVTSIKMAEATVKSSSVCDMSKYVKFLTHESYKSSSYRWLYIVIDGRTTKNEVNEWMLSKLGVSCFYVACIVDVRGDKTYTHTYLEFRRRMYIAVLRNAKLNGMSVHIARILNGRTNNDVYKFFISKHPKKRPASIQREDDVVEVPPSHNPIRAMSEEISKLKREVSLRDEKIATMEWTINYIRATQS